MSERNVFMNQRSMLGSIATLTTVLILMLASSHAVGVTVDECLADTGYAIRGFPSSGGKLPTAPLVPLFHPTVPVISCSPGSGSVGVTNADGSANANYDAGIGIQAGTAGQKFATNLGTGATGLVDLEVYLKFRVDKVLAPGQSPVVDVSVSTQLEIGPVFSSVTQAGDAVNTVNTISHGISRSFPFPIPGIGGGIPGTPHPIQVADGEVTNFSGGVQIYANEDFILRTRFRISSGASNIISNPPGSSSASLIAFLSYVIGIPDDTTISYAYESAFGLPQPSLGSFITTVPLPAPLGLFCAGLFGLYMRSRR